MTESQPRVARHEVERLGNPLRKRWERLFDESAEKTRMRSAG